MISKLDICLDKEYADKCKKIATEIISLLEEHNLSCAEANDCIVHCQNLIMAKAMRSALK